MTSFRRIPVMADKSNETADLKREIAFLTSLIQSHKQSQQKTTCQKAVLAGHKLKSRNESQVYSSDSHLKYVNNQVQGSVISSNKFKHGTSTGKKVVNSKLQNINSHEIQEKQPTSHSNCAKKNPVKDGGSKFVRTAMQSWPDTRLVKDAKSTEETKKVLQNQSKISHKSVAVNSSTNILPGYKLVTNVKNKVTNAVPIQTSRQTNVQGNSKYKYVCKSIQKDTVLPKKEFVTATTTLKSSPNSSKGATTMTRGENIDKKSVCSSPQGSKTAQTNVPNSSKTKDISKSLKTKSISLPSTSSNPMVPNVTKTLSSIEGHIDVLQKAAAASGASIEIVKPKQAPFKKCDSRQQNSPYKFVKGRSGQTYNTDIIKPSVLKSESKVVKRTKYTLIKKSNSPAVAQRNIPSATPVRGTRSFSPGTVKLTTRYRLVKKAVLLSNKRAKKLLLVKRPNFIVTRKSRYKTRKENQFSPQKLNSPHKSSTWTKKYSLKRDNTSEIEPTIDINKLLGRKVTNMSSNKYKFIKGKMPNEILRTNGMRRKSAYFQRRNSFKVDRRQITPGNKLLKRRLTTRSPFSIQKVGNVKALSLRTKTITVRGSKYSVGQSGRSLKRIAASPVTLSHTPKLSESSVKLVANRSLNRSIATATAAKYKKQNKIKKRKYCIFYNRFGKCNRGEKCTFIHDPEKIAVCTRFLRGTCKVNDCPFSHKVAKEKMPACHFFLKGVCNKEDCPYLHVKVNKDADVCKDFLNGYCPLGEKCKKHHTLVCVEFSKTGLCSQGKKCKLQHPRTKTTRKKARKRSSTSLQDETERPSKKTKIAQSSSELQDEDDDIFAPLSERHLPSFIALQSSNDETNDKNPPSKPRADTPLQIKPRLSFGTKKTLQ